MVKYSSATTSDTFRNAEQYKNCSSLLKEAEDPPLEELDPAILSCGLPAIILSDIHPILAAPIRYTANQLQAMRKHSLCFRRPAIADDPKVARFSIWRPVNTQRKSCLKERKPNRNDDSSKGNLQERSNNNDQQARENNLITSRVRRNYEFSNRNHHAIVKSYKGGDDRDQDAVTEEEPEWVASGPTSRLDTIELRGFDEDVPANALPSMFQTSSEKNGTTESKTTRDKTTERHISFYDELHHYEHVHPKRAAGGNTSKQHDTSCGKENDIESVATSSTNSPPPARSTPTKSQPDHNNNNNWTTSGQKSQPQNNGINVNNFEEFMKFDSLFGSDNGPGAQAGSRFSKWFRRGGGSSNQIPNQDGRRVSYNTPNDIFGNFFNAGGQRFQHERPAQRFASGTAHSSRHYQGANVFDQNIQTNAGTTNVALKRLIDMVAQNQANNNIIAQRQYLGQLFNKNQQSEFLRRMLMKNTMDNVADPGQHQHQQQQQPQQPRIPTHRELQFHTQSIMQNALLRKKLQDNHKLLCEQKHQVAAVAAAAAAAAASAEPNAVVQQFVQSVCPNVQRSLSVLSQTKANQNQPKFNQPFLGGSGQMQQDLSASLQQMLLSPSQQRSLGCRFGKA